MDVNGWVFMAWRFFGLCGGENLNISSLCETKFCLRGMFQDGHGVAVGFVVNDDD
jgi:hypothetical protein